MSGPARLPAFRHEAAGNYGSRRAHVIHEPRRLSVAGPGWRPDAAGGGVASGAWRSPVTSRGIPSRDGLLPRRARRDRGRGGRRRLRPPRARDPAVDHLVSGLVPLAVAGALAWAYPRLRAGARASVAIVCGVLAAVAGVSDGLRHVAVDRLSGDDVTVILAGVVGLALAIDGVGRLWRSRRSEGRVWARRFALAVAAALATFFVVLPVCLAIVATHKARSPVTATLGRDMTLRTADGLSLAASYVPSRNGAAVIVFPGRTPATLRHARLLAAHGYGVLTLDRRGEGESEGELNLFGWNGEGDLRAALDFLSRRPDVERGRIAGIGLSVGGELLLQPAAHDQRLRAVVSEGAGVRSLAEHLQTPASVVCSAGAPTGWPRRRPWPCCPGPRLRLTWPSSSSGSDRVRSC